MCLFYCGSVFAVLHRYIKKKGACFFDWIIMENFVLYTPPAGAQKHQFLCTGKCIRQMGILGCVVLPPSSRRRGKIIFYD